MDATHCCGEGEGMSSIYSEAIGAFQRKMTLLHNCRLFAQTHKSLHLTFSAFCSGARQMIIPADLF